MATPEVKGREACRDERVLVLAPSGSDASVVCHRLDGAGIDCLACHSVAELCEEIAAGAGSAIISQEVLTGSARAEIGQVLAKQPEWSDFPMMLIVWPSDEDDFTWQVLRSFEGTAHLILLERPLRTATLLSAAQVALQSRRRQYQLRDQLAERKLLTDSLPILIGYVDSEQKYRFVNAKYAEWFGKSVEEITGHRPDSLVGPEAYERSRPYLERALAGEEVAYENRVITAEGESRDLLLRLVPRRNAQGETIGALVTATDVTELKRAEHSLRESERNFRLALEGGDLGTWECDIQSGIVTGDARSCAIFGIEQNRTVPLSEIRRRIHREDAEQFRAAIASIRGSGPSRDYTIETRVVPSDGEVRWIVARGKIVFDNETRRPERMIGVLQDITARKVAEQRLRDVNQMLESRVAERTERLQRLAKQLRSLANDLTQTEQRERRLLAQKLHDGLQQMLVAVKMRVDLCAALPEPAELQEQLAEVRQLLDETIQVSRSLSIELSPPVLHQSGLLDALRWLQRWFADSHHFHVQLCVETEPPTLPDDVKAFLFFAVRELLFNSVKHSGTDASRLTVRMDEDRVRIDVEDDGHGFDPDVVDHNTSHEGGFGLFSIRERLDAIGGKLSIDSAPGQGTCFSIYSPPLGTSRGEVAANGDGRFARRGSNGRSHAEEDGNDRVRILVVDDHKIVRDGLVLMLNQQEAFEVIGEAAHGIEAIERVNALHPDIVVMDVNMPQMNGIEATRVIKRGHPEIAVIGLSLHQEEDMADTMRDAGATAYLRKDGHSEQLFATIMAAGRRS